MRSNQLAVTGRQIPHTNIYYYMYADSVVSGKLVGRDDVGVATNYKRRARWLCPPPPPPPPTRALAFHDTAPPPSRVHPPHDRVARRRTVTGAGRSRGKINARPYLGPRADNARASVARGRITTKRETRDGRAIYHNTRRRRICSRTPWCGAAAVCRWIRARKLTAPARSAASSTCRTSSASQTCSSGFCRW